MATAAAEPPLSEGNRTSASPSIRLAHPALFGIARVGEEGIMTSTPSFLYTALAMGRKPEQFTSNVEYKVDDALPLTSAQWHVEWVELDGGAFLEGVFYNARRLHCSTG
jgi:hypothetical protein